MFSAKARILLSDATRRPRLILVLSGGGARGAAHIGILKVFEEMHVPVEMVVGTSMGSIVGGLYATGWTPDQMEALLRDIDWSRVFIDRVDRDEKTYRRRQDDSRFFIKAKIRFKDGSRTSRMDYSEASASSSCSGRSSSNPRASASTTTFRSPTGPSRRV